MSDEMITNPNGNGTVAIKWVLPRMPKPTKVDDTIYIFEPRMNVFMAWAKPEHVDRLLAFREKTCNCNNGTYRNAFMLANLLDVNLWVYGNREGKPQ